MDFNAEYQNLPAEAIAMGLSEDGAGMTCQAYTGSNCVGTEQNMDIKSGQTFGCTGSQIGTISSVNCQSYMLELDLV
jgi:hypothetical protein